MYIRAPPRWMQLSEYYLGRDSIRAWSGLLGYQRHSRKILSVSDILGRHVSHKLRRTFKASRVSRLEGITQWQKDSLGCYTIGSLMAFWRSDSKFETTIGVRSSGDYSIYSLSDKNSNSNSNSCASNKLSIFDLMESKYSFTTRRVKIAVRLIRVWASKI